MYSYLVDTHTHLFSEEFTDDIVQVVERATDARVRQFILPAIDSSTFNDMVSLAKRYPAICHPAIGLHPTSVNEDYEQELDFVKKQLETNSYVAVGEIGIDCYWSVEFLEQQRYVFREQLGLAVEYGLPIIIHSRNSFEEIFAIASEFAGKLTGVFHAFSGTVDDYLKIKSLGGFKVGVGGVLTFKNSGLSSVIKQVELEDIVLETDSPYLAPVPNRGKRNESSYLPLIAQHLADIKGVSLAEVVNKTTENAVTTFHLKSN